MWLVWANFILWERVQQSMVIAVLLRSKHRDSELKINRQVLFRSSITRSRTLSRTNIQTNDTLLTNASFEVPLWQRTSRNLSSAARKQCSFVVVLGSGCVVLHSISDGDVHIHCCHNGNKQLKLEIIALSAKILEFKWRLYTLKTIWKSLVCFFSRKSWNINCRFDSRSCVRKWNWGRRRS